jgi:cardiolipin synthase A/B
MTGLRFLAAGAMAAALSACAVTPPVARDEAGTASAAASSVKAVAQQVSVTSHGGRMTQAERERLLKRLANESGLLQRHVAAMSAFGEVDLFVGNDAKLLLDGPATFAAMFEAIERAKRSVLLEMYIIEDEAISQRLAALLAKKRQQGVYVGIIYDAVGSIGTEDSYFDALRAAGVAVCAFNPLNPAGRGGRYYDIAQRDHRKILSVDREVGFTGGINISGVYSSGSFGRSKPPAGEARKNGWRDTQIQLRGPAVSALDDLWRATWRSQACTDGPPPPAAPPQTTQVRHGGQHVVRIVPSSPQDPFNRTYSLLLTAIDAAQKSVHLTMAYFAPGDDMVDALCDAARRGVNVELVLPSLSDFEPVLHAGRARYGQLLEAGVKIHELQDAVLHAKTAVIDGVVSTVGSSNMDWRSFSANTEVNAVVLGEDFGVAMQRMFERDVAASEPVTLQAWNARPLWQRTKEGLARLFERWW